MRELTYRVVSACPRPNLPFVRQNLVPFGTLGYTMSLENSQKSRLQCSKNQAKGERNREGGGVARRGGREGDWRERLYIPMACQRLWMCDAVTPSSMFHGTCHIRAGNNQFPERLRPHNYCVTRLYPANFGVCSHVHLANNPRRLSRHLSRLYTGFHHGLDARLPRESEPKLPTNP